MVVERDFDRETTSGRFFVDVVKGRKDTRCVSCHTLLVSIIFVTERMAQIRVNKWLRGQGFTSVVSKMRIIFQVPSRSLLSLRKVQIYKKISNKMLRKYKVERRVFPPVLKTYYTCKQVIQISNKC